MADRFENLAIGEQLEINNVMFTIVGYFEAAGSRAREIGTLRALGFSRRSILSSFLFESVILCLMGGALGYLATLPFNGLSTGTMNQFSEITFSFRFGPRVLMQGVMLAVIMGLLGGILPAIRAVRMNTINALRER